MAENSFKPQIEEAKADIRSIVAEVAKADKEIIGHLSNIREKFKGTFKITTPDGLTDLLNNLNSTMTKLNGTLDTQTNNTVKLNNAKSRLKNLSAEEVVNQRALARNADLQATATSKLVGAYERLNAKRKIAKNNLRNLISAEKQNRAEIRRAQKEYDRLTARINKANRATSNFTNNSLGGMVRGFRNLFGAFGIVGGATLIASLTRDMFNLIKTLESLDYSLKAVTESQSEFLAVQEFLLDISERYGVNLIATTERFTKFLAASKQSNISLDETRRIFESVTKASAVLGLKTDELSGVYLALEQMLSKGKVTTEELRRQLGERLPGAFGIMADALGVTVSKLDEMLKKGEILSEEALPKFAIALEKAYGIESVQKVDTLAAAQGRLETAWISFVNALNSSEGRLTKIFKSLLEDVQLMLEDLESFIKTAAELNKEEIDKAQKNAFDEALARAETFANQYGEGQKNITKKLLESLIESAEENRKQVLDNIEQLFGSKGGLVPIDISEEGERQLQKLNIKVAQFTGTIDAYKQALNDLNKEKKIDVDEDKKKLEAIKGSIAWLEQYIKRLEEEQSKLAITTEGYRIYTQMIEKANGELVKLKATLDNMDVELVFEINGEDVKASQKAILDIYEKAYNDRLEKAKEINDGIAEYQDQQNKEEARKLRQKRDLYIEIFGEITETFSDIFDIDMGKFDFLFDGLKNSVEDWAGLSKELIGSVLDASLNRYQVELQEAQASRDLILNNELATEKQKRLAREKFEKEERKIKVKAAKAEKRNNLLKIAADTAAGIVSALAQIPKFDFGVSASLFAGFIAATGAAQAAIVAAQPIPEFKGGHLSGTHSGKAKINDANRRDYQEVVERGSGQVEIYKNRDEVIDMKRGDKVHKSMDSFLSYHDIQRDVLNMSIQSQNEKIGRQEKGFLMLGKIDEMRKDFKEATEKMEKLAKRPIQNHNHITIDQPYNEYRQ